MATNPIYTTQGMHAYCLFRAIEWFCVQYAQVQLVVNNMTMVNVI